MATETEVKPEGYVENTALLPVKASDKLYGLRTFTFMMFSLNTCIPMFLLGSLSWGAFHLSIWETIVAAFLGNLFPVIAMSLNAHAGVKYGVPYPVQARSSFGFWGTHIPTILRGSVGAGWFGVEIWAGSYALTALILLIFGTIPAHSTAAFVDSQTIKYLVPVIIIYVVAAWLVLGRGLKGIGAIADYGGPLMLLYFIWLVYFIGTRPGAAWSSALLVGTGFGAPFLTMLGIQTNWWATMAINISDLSRGAKKFNSVWIGALVGIVLGQVVGTVLGYLLTGLTGVYLPQIVIITYAPNAVAIIVGLLFAFLAPFSTDITANMPALVNIFTSVFRQKWKVAVAIACVIGFLITPWWGVKAAADYTNYVGDYAGAYGIILGPIAGILIADYWFLKKQSFDLKRLYTKGPGGYWGRGGVIWSGVLALLLAIFVGGYGLSYVLGNILNVPGFLVSNIGSTGHKLILPFPGNLGWYTGIIFGFLFEYILAKVMKDSL